MKRLLLCAGLGNREKGLLWLQKLVERHQPEGLLFAGGVLDGRRQYAARDSTPWGMTAKDALFLEHFFEVLGKLKVFAAVIPGPEDTPLEDFLRLGMHAEVDFPNLHIVHGTVVEKKDLAIAGVGGELYEEKIPVGDGCSRVMAEYFLRQLWTADKPHKVLLLPAPPPGTLGGMEGNPIVGEFIDSYHPALCVVKGSNSCRGMERVAGTLVVNPGSLADGCAAWLDWGKEAVEQIDLLSKQKEEALFAFDSGGGD